MFLPSFRNLIEIEALKKENQINLQEIIKEGKRISDLQDRRLALADQNEELLLAEKKLNLSSTQHQIDQLYVRLKKLNLQIFEATSKKEQEAFDHQINTVKIESEELETLYFSNLTKSEEIQSTILNNKEFLQGSLQSLEIIKVEVDKNILLQQKMIKDRDLRIQSLTELLPTSFLNLYLELEKKFNPKRPVSFLLDKTCSECHLMTDSFLKSSLEEGRSIETCPSCGRLLIPETAKIY